MILGEGGGIELRVDAHLQEQHDLRVGLWGRVERVRRVDRASSRTLRTSTNHGHRGLDNSELTPFALPVREQVSRESMGEHASRKITVGPHFLDVLA